MSLKIEIEKLIQIKQFFYKSMTEITISIQFTCKNYNLVSVGTPNLSDTSLGVEVLKNLALLRRWRR